MRSMLALVTVVVVAACSRNEPHKIDVVAAAPAPARPEATFVAPPPPKQTRRDVTFVVSPLAQTIAASPEDPLKGLAWCLGNKPKLTATIANHSSSAFYLPASGIGTVGIWKFQRDGKDVVPLQVPINFESDVPSTQWRAMKLLRQGESASFLVFMCSMGAGEETTEYPNVGPGTYTFTMSYHYDGPDYRGAVSAPTLHDTLLTEQITLHVK